MVRLEFRSLLGVLLLGLGICSFASAQPFPQNDFRLEFDELGQLRPSSEPTLAAILERVPVASDVFLFSHGWRNDSSTAEDRYQAFINGMGRRFPRARFQGNSFRPLLIGIYWPSAWFPGDNCFASQPNAAAVTSWATSAFPSAAAAGGEAFRRELAVVTSSLSGITPWDRYRQLPEIIAKWNGGLGPTEPEVGGEPTLVQLPPWRLAEVFDQSVASNSVLAQAGALRTFSPCSLLNILSFWAMKKRAGEVGARGVYLVLQRILVAGGAASEPARVHLIGHSFGSKVLTAAVTGPVGAARSAHRQVQSLILIQAAFSHFAFASVQELQRFGIGTSAPGRYREVVDEGLIRGPVVAFYSSQDAANNVFYPIGAALAQDYLAKPLVTADSILRDCAQPGEDKSGVRSADRDLRTEIPKYGAIGANGIQGVVNARCLALGRGRALPSLADTGGRILNVDASDVITGHSEIAYPEVFDLIWEVVASTRQ